jgi:hypothetical protein
MASKRLQRALEAFFEDGGLGEVFNAPLDLILGEHDIVQPDLLIVGDAAQVTQRAIEGPPLLVVEILSPSTRAQDRGVTPPFPKRSPIPTGPVSRSISAPSGAEDATPLGEKRLATLDRGLDGPPAIAVLDLRAAGLARWPHRGSERRRPSWSRARPIRT